MHSRSIQEKEKVNFLQNSLIQLLRGNVESRSQLDPNAPIVTSRLYDTTAKKMGEPMKARRKADLNKPAVFKKVEIKDFGFATAHLNNLPSL